MFRIAMSLMLTLLFSFTSAVTNARQSKQWVKIGTSVPYQLATQFEWQTNSNIYISAEIGSFASPYQDLVLNHLTNVSNNPIIPALTGAILEDGYLYALRGGKLIGSNNRFQLGGYIQHISLRGDRKPTALMGEYFDVDVNNLPSLSLSSQITVAGIDMGMRFPISPKFSIHTSVSLGYAVDATTEISSSEIGFNQIGDALGQEAAKAIQSKGFLPSVNVFLAYRLFGQNTGNHGKPRSKKARRLLSRQTDDLPKQYDEVDR